MLAKGATGNRNAGLAVDGNDVNDISCSITGVGDIRPWWKVQLAYPVWVTHVELTNKRTWGKYTWFFTRFELKSISMSLTQMYDTMVYMYLPAKNRTEICFFIDRWSSACPICVYFEVSQFQRFFKKRPLVFKRKFEKRLIWGPLSAWHF